MKEDGERYCFANWRRQEKRERKREKERERERRKRDFNNDDVFKVYL